MRTEWESVSLCLVSEVPLHHTSEAAVPVRREGAVASPPRYSPVDLGMEVNYQCCLF